MRVVFWTRDESREPANNRRETNLAEALKNWSRPRT
jgi:hypothetical protein